MPVSIEQKLFEALKEDFFPQKKVNNDYELVSDILRDELAKYDITDIDFLSFPQIVDTLRILKGIEYKRYKNLLKKFKPISEFTRPKMPVKFVSSMPEIAKMFISEIKNVIKNNNLTYKVNKTAVIAYKNKEKYFAFRGFTIDSNEQLFVRYTVFYTDKFDVSEIAKKMRITITTTTQQKLPALEFVKLDELDKLLKSIL